MCTYKSDHTVYILYTHTRTKKPREFFNILTKELAIKLLLVLLVGLYVGQLEREPIGG